MNARQLKTLICVVSAGCCASAAPAGKPLPKLTVVAKPDRGSAVPLYPGGRAPLQPAPFLRLPIGSFEPGGWLRRALELQRDGLAGNLGKVSAWLTKDGNAWLSADSKGEFGWEEVPYWLRGYARIAYALRDPSMLAESKIWIEAVLAGQRPDGDFGPVQKDKTGRRDLWAQMLMLQVLEHYYEYSGDERVLRLMARYFRWESTIPDGEFLETYWEKLRGGDNLASVYWLYERNGDPSLLELAAKIDRNTSNWRMPATLPDWHVVNNAQGFREPASFFQQSGIGADLEATYRNFRLIRDLYGQVPGGMFGADEIARPGYTDPHQGTELCAMVEQIQSDGMLVNITGDPAWAENAEDVAFNSLPASMTADYRALRYLTAPNMVISDAQNHAPGVHNKGPFFLMNPFSSRCCQHNHTSAWVNFLESSWTATADAGLAAQLYTAGRVTAKAGARGAAVTLNVRTRYPFEETVEIHLEMQEPTEFPLYLRIPSWCAAPSVWVNGTRLESRAAKGYFKLVHAWHHGDRIRVRFPMAVGVRKWERNGGSVSVDYGPLTFSLQITERYVQRSSTETAIFDSRWQRGADAKQWPSFEILPDSPWNYGLMLRASRPEASFELVRRPWPASDYPFTQAATPLKLRARGKRIPDWRIDAHGMAGTVPRSPVRTAEPAEGIALLPMGAARLRISAFPVVQ